MLTVRNAPHRFYGRSAIGRIPLDVWQIRDGTIEAVCPAGGINQQTRRPAIFGHTIEGNLIGGLDRYRGAWDALGLGAPLAIGIALTGVQGAEIEPGFRAYRRQTKTID